MDQPMLNPKLFHFTLKVEEEAEYRRKHKKKHRLPTDNYSDSESEVHRATDDKDESSDSL